MKHLKRFNEDIDEDNEVVIPPDPELDVRTDQEIKDEREERNLRRRGSRDSDIEPVVVWP